MRSLFYFCFFVSLSLRALPSAQPGYSGRIKNYIDSLHIVDTHEHMFNPESLRNTYFLDFSLLLQQNSWDDLVSAGLPDTMFNYIFNKPVPALNKWKVIEPYWKKSLNTSSNCIIKRAFSDIYGFDELNDSTVTKMSAKMKEVYGVEWFNFVMKKICRFDFVLQESDYLGDKSDFIRYTRKFSEWLTVRSKSTIDSIAAVQTNPIQTLESFTASLQGAFEEALQTGMVAVKINIAYSRTLRIDNVDYNDAKRIFSELINGDKDNELSYEAAKPLQDYMVHQLLMLAEKHSLPVAIHTGLQAGAGNILENSDPRLLTNLFREYPGIKFVLYHGSYPFGRRLAAIVKSCPNVWIDMNWTYSISPSYAENYLTEWLETVPANKIMAFGGDQRCVENTYGELAIAKRIITEVLIAKVKNGSMTESAAKDVAKLILHDNAVSFYKLK